MKLTPEFFELVRLFQQQAAEAARRGEPEVAERWFKQLELCVVLGRPVVIQPLGVLSHALVGGALEFFYKLRGRGCGVTEARGVPLPRFDFVLSEDSSPEVQEVVRALAGESAPES